MTPDQEPRTCGVPVVAMDPRYSCGRQFFAAPFYAEDVPTHIAFPLAEAEALEAVAEAARRRITCRQAVPPEVMAADREMYAALTVLAELRSKP